MIIMMTLLDLSSVRASTVILQSATVAGCQKKMYVLISPHGARNSVILGAALRRQGMLGGPSVNTLGYFDMHTVEGA